VRRIPWLVRRRADRVVEAWTAGYPDPEQSDDQILRDVTRWVNVEADALMDYAQDRPLRHYVALVLAFAGSVFLVSISNAFRDNGFEEHTWWATTMVVVPFFGTAFLLIRPLKTSATRALIRKYLGDSALAALRRRRAFVLPAPQAVKGFADWRDAERLAAAWMAHLGAPEAKLTRKGADGGVDVISDAFAAQVKNRTDKVSVMVVRELQGAAQRVRKQPVFFTTGSYSKQACDYARAMGMALFILRPLDGRLVGANPQGTHYRAHGFHVPLPEPLRGVRSANETLVKDVVVGR